MRQREIPRRNVWVFARLQYACVCSTIPPLHMHELLLSRGVVDSSTLFSLWRSSFYRKRVFGIRFSLSWGGPSERGSAFSHGSSLRSLRLLQGGAGAGAGLSICERS